MMGGSIRVIGLALVVIIGAAWSVGDQAAGAPSVSVAVPTTLEDRLMQALEAAFPLRYGKKGDRITFSKPNITALTESHVSFRVKVKHKKTRGFPQYTTSGKGTIEGRVARLLDGGQQKVCVSGLTVTNVDLKNINKFLDEQYFQKELNKKMHEVCMGPGPCTWDPDLAWFCVVYSG